MVGIYQLHFTRIPPHAARIPPHAALAETVDGTIFQRQEQTLNAKVNNNESNYLHPKWLLEKIQQVYPAQWEEILEANN